MGFKVGALKRDRTIGRKFEFNWNLIEKLVKNLNLIKKVKKYNLSKMDRNFELNKKLIQNFDQLIVKLV